MGKGLRVVGQHNIRALYFTFCSSSCNIILDSPAGACLQKNEPVQGIAVSLCYCKLIFYTFMDKFRELGLSEEVLEALRVKGFEEPTPIQAQTIPLLLSGKKDIIGQAQTGTGKTASFGLPLIERLDDQNRAVQALVLAPTRELAIQVAEEISSFKGNKKLWITPIYGGQSYTLQLRGLKRGSQIVVGTPGRIRDHIERKTLDLSQVKYVVLDEADEMLNMGFQEEVEDILQHVPEQRRMLLFSATMPKEILKLAKRYMGDYDLVEVKKEQLTADLTQQIYFEVRDSERFEALCRIIDTEPDFYGLVFCRTKVDTDKVAHQLNDRGYDAAALHGDISQSQRETILRGFRKRSVQVLVATDVAARGIDVKDVSHVINYQLPQDPESYVHRIGRTGRAGKEGTAITFISPSEFRSLMFIQKVANTKIKKEKLPQGKEVVEYKKQRILSKLEAILAKDEDGDYVDLARQMLETADSPERVLAALLRDIYKDELKEDNYKSITQTSATVDQKGTSRLFVAKGKADGMTPPRLAEFLEKEGGIDQQKIDEIRVMDNFSFVTVPFIEAEQLLAVFSKWKGSRKPLVTKAKENDGPRGGGGGGKRFKGREEGGGKFKDRGDFGRFSDREDSGKGFGKKKKEFGDRPSFGEKPSFAKKRSGGESSGWDKPARPAFEKSFGDRPRDKSAKPTFAKKTDRPVKTTFPTTEHKEPKPKKSPPAQENLWKDIKWDDDLSF